MSSRDALYWFTIILGLILVLSLYSPTREIVNTELSLTNGDMESIRTAHVAYIPHDPISINGDSDFNDTAVLEGWKGNGSLEAPFIIENLSIDCGGIPTHCIYIGNTRAHFVIRNCSLKNAASYSGITFDNTWNGVVCDNTIANNQVGIRIHT